MSGLTDVTWCNIAQIVGESNRFLFHVMLVHVATSIIEGKKDFFGQEFFRTMIITATAIVMYHLFFRKMVEPKVEKMKLICYTGKDRTDKKKEINKLFPTGPDVDSGSQRNKSRQKNKYRFEASTENNKNTRKKREERR
ncbi:hypothetical protein YASMINEVIRUS_787 [Yasminevirus sp. GU-2018]|uniref:Uncharacterized protein n=1 Tax=Yasminevirus sp. GU-2018 TaxID=2420051 RepID=A0A5K0UA33_9VIRU|nr:hypothetical protein YASMINEVIRUS_787 [Yasminevirus sp. GU-2018]